MCWRASRRPASQCARLSRTWGRHWRGLATRFGRGLPIAVSLERLTYFGGTELDSAGDLCQNAAGGRGGYRIRGLLCGLQTTAAGRQAMSQRVLVTGGLGYLGSILCEHLLAAGFRVRAVDNLLYGQGQQGLFHLCARP